MFPAILVFLLCLQSCFWLSVFNFCHSQPLSYCWSAALQQLFFLPQYVMFKTEGQVLLCLPPHWGRVFGHDKKWLVSNDIHCKEWHTQRNTTQRNIFWIHCFAVFLIRSILWFLLPQHGRFSMALFRAIKHMRVWDTYFPKHILVILRHACLGVIWQSQVAVVQVSHFPSQAQTSHCIYNK